VEITGLVLRLTPKQKNKKFHQFSSPAQLMNEYRELSAVVMMASLLSSIVLFTDVLSQHSALSEYRYDCLVLSWVIDRG
jgi:hypothetical protein